MSKQKSSKSKARSGNTKKKTINTQKKKITPTTSRAKASTVAPPKTELSLGMENYKWMGIGIVLLIIGMLLMTGGAMPSPDVWEASEIYSFRRTVLAPIVILAGLVVEIYAIFKK